MEYRVELKSAHLIVPPEITKTIFGDEQAVYVAYKEDSKAFLISPKSNSWFSKLHKSSEVLLKSKDMAGTKSISIREFLIDHELDTSNKTLSCTVNTEKQFLKINF